MNEGEDLQQTERRSRRADWRTAEQSQGGGPDPLDDSRTIQLREEELVAHKEMRHAGDVQVRTVVEESLSQLEVEAFAEEVAVEHVPVNRAVSEREDPRQEGEKLIVPIYEEELIVTKRLVLREELHVSRIRTAETRLFQESLKRDRLIVEDPDESGLVHERYPSEDSDATSEHEEAGFLENLKRKVMQP